MYTHPLYHWPPKTQWRQKLSGSRKWKPFSTYIHFPFCRNICDFCGYETRQLSKAVVSASAFPKNAVSQIQSHAHLDDFTSASLRAVFFGGGTASLMSDHGIAGILSALRQYSASTDVPEITLECEPGTIGRLKLKNVRAYGVNRVSVCAQSLSDSQLQVIGRMHTTEQSLRLIDDCLETGIQNIHLDLMYGLPDQTQGAWEHTLEQASLLPVSHISTYKLFIFKHGVLDREKLFPRAQFEPDSLTLRTRAMHDASREILGAAGFSQYTLTEFSRPGSQSEYIRSCFDGGDLLPIGPAAFGRCGNEVWENSPYVHLYGTDGTDFDMRALRLTALEAFKRDVILGLWLLSVPTDRVAARHGITIRQELLDLFRELCREDLVEFTGNKLSFAERHRFGAGQVMACLARMDASLWGIVETDQCLQCSAESGEGESAADRGTKLNTIFRMARRDTLFFNELRRNPLATLRGLGYSLDDPDVLELVSAINCDDACMIGAEKNEVHSKWATVQREHVQALP